MALTATMYNFDVQLADVDRGVYEPLSFRVACQPSETPQYLMSRVLAYCLEFTDGIGFSRGIAEPDTPALAVRDLTGALTAWIDVGAPDAARLHKAGKAATRVAVYTHRDPTQLIRSLTGERIHRAESLELYAIDRALIDALVTRLDRRNRWELSVTGRRLYVNVQGQTLEGDVTRISLG